jgi:tetratricopeptide (TPR) repeat protein
VKRAIKIFWIAAMFLAATAITFCDAADISSDAANAKPGVINGVILDRTNAMMELDPEEQATRFKTNWDAYITSCTKAIELTPDDWRVYARRGHPELSKGDYEAAIADYTRAIKLSTNNSGWYYDRGLAKRSKGDFEGAIADMTKANEFDPKHFALYDSYLAITYNSCGYVKLSKGDFDGAIADFNKALKITPDVESNPDNTSSLSSYNKRGGAKRFKGDLDGAIADYTKIIELKNAAEKMTYAPAISARYRMFYYTAAYYNRGLTKAAKGDFDGAKNDFTEALKLNPALSEAQMRLDELNKK